MRVDAAALAGAPPMEYSRIMSDFNTNGQAPQSAPTNPAYTQQPAQQPAQEYTQSAYQQQPPQGQPYTQPGYQPYSQQGYQPQPVYPAPKSKIAAGLFGIFLGAFGVHNFYLGYTGKAVAQLLLTLLGWILLGLGPIAAYIWGLVEGILIISSSYGSEWHRDGQGLELKD